MTRILYVLFSTVAISLMSCSSGDDIITAEGVSKELAEFRKSSLSEIQYDLEISIPEDFTGPIIGRESISLNISDLSTPLILDFKVPEGYLKSVKVNKVDANYSFTNEHIIIPAENLIDGQNQVEIEFRVGETSLNRNPDFLYTLFVPERARTAFPCFDQPNLKATFKLALSIPEKWIALSNGAVIEEELADGVKHLSFQESEPISTYLFDFVVGDFKVVKRDVGGREMAMLHRETDSIKVSRNLDAIFELHRSSIAWLEEYTGIPYPFQKFDFALIPSFQYGGMEHPGAISYKASSLFLDEMPTQNQLLGRASLIAHETAHMWFGDLVTMEWFNDVWMKEVFANFMAAKMVNPSFPEINHDLRFLLAHYPSAYSIDRSRGTHPIQQPLENLKDAGTLYGAIIYQKAPIVMRMLERKVGEGTFRGGIQTYLNNHSFGNASWDDLIAVLDSVSEEEVSVWSNQWIKQAGMPGISPYLRTSDNGKIKEFSIHQRSTQNDSKFWTQDLAVILEASDSVYKYNTTIDGNFVEIDSAKGLEDATFIMCNSDGYGYGYFRMGPLTQQRWLDSIEFFRDPVQRGVGWISLWERAVNRSVRPEQLLISIIRNIPLEQDPLIQQYMLSSLQTIYWKLLSEENRKANAYEIEELLWTTISNLEDSKLKRVYFNAYRSIAISENGIKKLYQLWSKQLEIEGISLSESDFTTLACELAIRNWPESNTLIQNQLDQITNPDRKERLQFIAPSLSANKQVRDEFFESLLLEENRHHESWVQSALGYLHHPLRAHQSVEYITPTLDMLEEIQKTGDIFFPKRVLDNTFSGHRSIEAIDQVNQFLYRNNHYPANLKNKILQSADMMFRAQEIVEVQQDSTIVLF